MIRLLTALVVLSLSVACSARYDVPVSWTIDGRPAADACLQLAAPKVRFTLEQRDSPDGPVVDETQESDDCGKGSFAVRSASFARLFVDLLEGDVAYGSAPALDLAPGASYDADEPVATDIELHRGRVHARLTVVDQNCGDAGASSFSVTLTRETAPLSAETLVEDQEVACSGDGTAFFDYEPVEIGSRYNLFASTTIGGEEYATDDLGQGEGFIPERSLTDVVADLDVVGRPPEP